jgi:hypothetical protein
VCFVVIPYITVSIYKTGTSKNGVFHDITHE